MCKSLCACCCKCLPCCAVIFFFGFVLNLILFIISSTETSFVNWEREFKDGEVKIFREDKELFKDSKVATMIATIAYLGFTIASVFWIIYREKRAKQNKVVMGTNVYQMQQDDADASQRRVSGPTPQPQNQF
ncbi:hypothetical protein PPERSA_09689 [Pseudocohnilembus persalinus]|uniref:Uncharacterized protein n=1 Tax=Pseudocohnilembus persalinus TaxID=266149 RepID=A0A0V0R722_PSEPJ|nr:hypothetical protein PPERSA_09689 [Pseudocohnilembus persalinus]|eukprot:KRX10305.1 hypothetical protein PPERSA_09689 [Pseudocohnilembus persalinus]